ncbi:hypothetical protein [Halomonas sp. BMC6]|uniref:hypothetical protein n=1 Tax=Halomonas sp. BMC6 TaxID=3073244 RepID=UPI0030CB3F57
MQNLPACSLRKILLSITAVFRGDYHTYDTGNADKLLTSIHADAMLMLSTCWLELKEGKIGPDQPQPDIIAGAARRLSLTLEAERHEPLCDEIAADTEEHTHSTRSEGEENNSQHMTTDSSAKKSDYSPLAILIYALSHHLAKNLQGAFRSDDGIDFEALTYVLVPVYAGKPDKQRLLTYQLRGYGVTTEDRKDKQKNILYRDPVDEDLKTYWQTHHQDCLSAINDEPDDATALDAQEPSDA